VHLMRTAEGHPEEHRLGCSLTLTWDKSLNRIWLCWVTFKVVIMVVPIFQSCRYWIWLAQSTM
jgi:hypothetical protein